MKFDKFDKQLMSQYRIQVQCPQPPTKPYLDPDEEDSAVIRLFADQLEQYAADKKKYLIELSEYRKKEAEKYAQFKKDAIKEAGLTGHPKADKAFELAYKDAHSEGLVAVWNRFDDLADLLR